MKYALCLLTISGVLFSSPWPQFRHDAWHSGFSPDSAPSTRILRWRFLTGGQVWSSPAVSGDTLFVGSDDSTVYALNTTTSNPNGEMFWSRRLTGRVRGSPAAAFGYVYVTCLGNPAYLYCLRASDGQIQWQYNIGTVSIFNSSPAVVDSMVFVGSESRYLYCVKAITSNPNGELVWKYYTGKWIHGSPAVGYGRVYIGTAGGDTTGGYYLYCLEEFPPDSNGNLLWRYYIGNRRNGMGVSPAVVDSLVFFSFDDIDSPYNSELVALRAIPSFGDTLYWRYVGLDGMMSSPAVAYDRVYIGMESNSAIERSFLVFKEHPSNPPNAELIWRYYPIATIRSSPALANGKAYIGTDVGGNRLYCFNALSNTPETLWTYTTGGGIFSSPAVSNGMVYVGSWDRYVYAFGIPGVGINEKTFVNSHNGELMKIEVYPNPFRQKTDIRWQIADSRLQIINRQLSVISNQPSVSLKIYDVTGRLIRQWDYETMRQGDQITWDGKNDSGKPLSEGIYFLHIKEENLNAIKKIIMVK